MAVLFLYFSQYKHTYTHARTHARTHKRIQSLSNRIQSRIFFFFFFFIGILDSLFYSYILKITHAFLWFWKVIFVFFFFFTLNTFFLAQYDDNTTGYIITWEVSRIRSIIFDDKHTWRHFYCLYDRRRLIRKTKQKQKRGLNLQVLRNDCQVK